MAACTYLIPMPDKMAYLRLSPGEIARFSPVAEWMHTSMQRHSALQRDGDTYFYIASREIDFCYPTELLKLVSGQTARTCEQMLAVS